MKEKVESPTLVADAGVENVNSGVDGLIETGLLRRLLALRDVNVLQLPDRGVVA